LRSVRRKQTEPNQKSRYLPAAGLGFLLGVLLGALAAYNHDTWLDKLFSATAIIGVSLPHYWVGIVLVAIFAVVLNVLPRRAWASRVSRPAGTTSRT
jgi:ABC-type dipeptide/oligopeptide/nickel transport system permease component